MKIGKGGAHPVRKQPKHYGKLGGPHRGKKYDYDAAEQLEFEWWSQQDQDDEWIEKQQDWMEEDNNDRQK